MHYHASIRIPPNRRGWIIQHDICMKLTILYYRLLEGQIKQLPGSVSKQIEPNQSLKIQGDPETSAENSPQVINEKISQTDQVITEVNNEVAEGEVNDQVTKDMTTSANEVIRNHQTELISVEPNTHTEQKVTSVDSDGVITKSSHEEVIAESFDLSGHQSRGL